MSKGLRNNNVGPLLHPRYTLSTLHELVHIGWLVVVIVVVVC